jgi:hypothetical protein
MATLTAETKAMNSTNVVGILARAPMLASGVKSLGLSQVQAVTGKRNT